MTSGRRRRPRPSRLESRALDVVYRATELPYWYGRHGQLKHRIGLVAAEKADASGSAERHLHTPGRRSPRRGLARLPRFRPVGRRRGGWLERLCDGDVPCGIGRRAAAQPARATFERGEPSACHRTGTDTSLVALCATTSRSRAHRDRAVARRGPLRRRARAGPALRSR